MKLKALFLSLLCVCFLVSASAQKKLNIDLKANVIRWTGHAEVGSYAPAGTLNFKSGTVITQNENIKGAALIVDMSSMHQDNSQLLEHLKSSDFFDVNKYSTSVININKVVNGMAYGNLTIKNKTVNLTCPVTISRNADKIFISGSIVIDRTQYGIIYNSGSFFSGLGDKAIRNTFDVTFNVVADTK